MQHSDQALVDLAKQAQQGDIEAFTELFNRFQQPVLNYVYRMLGDRAAAEDVAQETFIRAHDRIDRLGPPWDFKSWLYRIASNLTVDYLRKSRKYVDVEEIEAMAEKGSSPRPPEGSVQTEQQRQDVWRALSTIPTTYRQALVLREFNQMGYKEMAQALECSYDGARQLVHRARMRFRDAYGLRVALQSGVERCRVLGEMLSSYHDGELDDDQRQEVRRHMETCPDCRATRESMKKIGLALGIIPLLKPSDAWAAGVLEQIRSRAGAASEGGSSGGQAPTGAQAQPITQTHSSGPPSTAGPPSLTASSKILKWKLLPALLGSAAVLTIVLLGAGIVLLRSFHPYTPFQFGIRPLAQSSPTLPGGIDPLKTDATPDLTPTPTTTATTTPIPPTPTATSTPLPPSPTPTASPTIVDTRPPTVAISHSPASRTRPNTRDRVTFTATASDKSGIAIIEIWVQEPWAQLPTKTKTCYDSLTCSYIGGPYLPGVGSYYAVASDPFGNSSTSQEMTLSIYRAR